MEKFKTQQEFEFALKLQKNENEAKRKAILNKQDYLKIQYDDKKTICADKYSRLRLHILEQLAAVRTEIECIRCADKEDKRLPHLYENRNNLDYELQKNKEDRERDMRAITSEYQGLMYNLKAELNVLDLDMCSSMKELMSRFPTKNEEK